MNFSSSIIGKLFTMIFGIILPKLYIDNFGSEINGLISSINGIFIYINLLEAGVGSASTQALFKPIAENNQGEVNSILSATRIYYRKSGVYCLACIASLTFLYPTIVKSSLNYWLIVLLFLISGVSFLTKFFLQGKYVILLNADNRAYVLSNISTAFQLVSNISKVVLILTGHNVIIVQLFFSLITILQAFFISTYIHKHYPQLKLKVKPDYSAISQKSAVLAQQVATIILNNTDVLILTFFCNLKIVSVYTIYNNMIFTQMLFLPQALTDAITAGLGHLYTDNKERFKTMYYLYEDIFIMISFSLLTVTFLLTSPFIILYTKNITDISYVDKWLPLLFYIMTLLSAFRTSNFLLINVAGKFNETTKSAIIEAMLNLVISVVLVNLWGIKGVVMGSIVAVLYRLIVISSYVNKEILNRNILIYINKLLLNFMPMLVVIVIYNFLNISIENYYMFIYASVCLVSTVIVLICVSNILFNNGFKNSVIKFYKSKRGE